MEQRIISKKSNNKIISNTLITNEENNNKYSIIRQGENIYKKNHFLAKIWDIMSYEPFNEFFDKYLNDYSDIQVAVVFFNLYKTIKEQYRFYFNNDITRGEMIYILKKVMNDKFMRKYFIDFTKNQGLLDKDYLDQKSNYMLDNMKNDINLLIKDL